MSQVQDVKNEHTLLNYESWIMILFKNYKILGLNSYLVFMSYQYDMF